MPKFIGPYKILKVMNESSNVTLELPQEFKYRKINPTFHTNLVRPYIKNNDILSPKRDTKVFYDFGNDEDQERLVEEILAHKWTNNNLDLQVECVIIYALADRLTISLTNDNSIPFSSITYDPSRSGDPESY